PIGFALISPDGKLFRVNQALCELFGRPEQELLGREAPLFDAAGGHVGHQLQRQLQRGERAFVQFEHRCETSAGRSIPIRVSLSAVRDASGAPLRYLAQVEDTSAATTAMEAATAQAELLEVAHDAIMEVELDSTVLFWNRAAEQLYGWSAQEAHGQRGRTLLNTRFPPGHEQLWEEFLRVGRWEGELVQTARDGRELVVSSRWSLRRDRQGRPRTLLAVNRDVTAKHLAQDALARSEESLAATLRSLTEGVIVTDPEERVTRMNLAAELLTGFSSAEARGLPLSQVCPLLDEQSGEPRESPVRQAMRQHAPVALAGRACLRTRAGQQVPVAVNGAPLRATGGEVAGGGVLVFRDVTEERRTHDALRRKKHEFRQLIDTLPDAVLILRDERVHYANAAAARMLGRAAPAQLVGTDVRELVPGSEREKLLRLVGGRAGGPPGGNEAMSELRFVRSGAQGDEGAELRVEVAPMSLPGFEGGPAVLLVGRDLTERRKLQERLLLSDRMASVGTLAAGVAHEINNPLAFVMGNLSFLQEELRELGAQLSEPALQERLREVRTALGEASQGAERVRLIVKDLHTFSRADEALKGRLDVHRALDSSIAMTANVVRHRARLVREYAQVPGVWANEARLGQVFVNLLVNAAHAIPEEAAPDAARPHEIRVRTRSAGAWVTVEVQDTGTGIAPQHRGRIFDPFYTTKPVG
ncbi:MAG TPA: PAS domain S-box protein, partial [Aggregicoccus sp.]|nr:PAS domain S-box protein [Aggregicoccus sp.]